MKAMYDIGVLSFVIGNHLEKPWVTKVEPSILDPDREKGHRHQPTTDPSNLRIVHEVNVQAMKKDFWDTLNGKPTALPPTQQKR